MVLAVCFPFELAVEAVFTRYTKSPPQVAQTSTLSELETSIRAFLCLSIQISIILCASLCAHPVPNRPAHKPKQRSPDQERHLNEKFAQMLTRRLRDCFSGFHPVSSALESTSAGQRAAATMDRIAGIALSGTATRSKTPERSSLKSLRRVNIHLLSEVFFLALTAHHSAFVRRLNEDSKTVFLKSCSCQDPLFKASEIRASRLQSSIASPEPGAAGENQGTGCRVPGLKRALP